MKEWDSDNGRVVRQAWVRRQQLLRPGHFSRNIYHPENAPAEKVVFPNQPFPDDVETKDSDIQPHDLQDATSFVFSDDSEQVQDYDTDCNVNN